MRQCSLPFIELGHGFILGHLWGGDQFWAPSARVEAIPTLLGMTHAEIVSKSEQRRSKLEYKRRLTTWVVLGCSRLDSSRLIDHMTLNGSDDVFTTYGTIYVIDSCGMGVSVRYAIKQEPFAFFGT